MLYDTRIAATRDTAIQAAVDAISRGDLIVLPTDTVYGIGADAFKPWAVQALRTAKGSGRQSPPAVLIGARATLDGLVLNLPAPAHDLVDAFWPGPLTILVEHTPTLQWDLGDTGGAVSVRMPLHPVALEVLRQTGPMAVSSANLDGASPALTAQEAQAQFGPAVAVYLDAGGCQDALPSSIVDLTGPEPQLLRAGALDLDTLRAVLPGLRGPGQ